MQRTLWRRTVYCIWYSHNLCNMIARHVNLDIKRWILQEHSVPSWKRNGFWPRGLCWLGTQDFILDLWNLHSAHAQGNVQIYLVFIIQWRARPAPSISIIAPTLHWVSWDRNLNIIWTMMTAALNCCFSGRPPLVLLVQRQLGFELIEYHASACTQLCRF